MYLRSTEFLFGIVYVSLFILLIFFDSLLLGLLSYSVDSL